MYIHERDNWTDFRWDMSKVSLLQEKVFRKQGLLYGRLSSLGFDSKLRAMAENLTYDVVYSSEIEGIRLNVDQVRSSIAHFWFVSIHPFEDGNGRLARILSDMLLARGEKSEFRFYNVSSQINKDKNHYYEILERMQHGDGDITEWLVWYMQKLVDALDEADTIVTTILNKSFFWQKASAVPMTERQTQMLNLFLDGYEAKITSKTWATLAKCSKDTAIRDIQDLVDKNILIEDIPGAKRPSYSIVYDAEDLSQFFTEVSISEENGIPYLKAIFKGKKPVSERLLKLDAERFKKGDLPLSNLLSKYYSYIAQSN